MLCTLGSELHVVHSSHLWCIFVYISKQIQKNAQFFHTLVSQLWGAFCTSIEIMAIFYCSFGLNVSKTEWITINIVRKCRCIKCYVLRLFTYGCMMQLINTNGQGSTINTFTTRKMRNIFRIFHNKYDFKTTWYQKDEEV